MLLVRLTFSKLPVQTLGHPVVDKVKASRFYSMKELRPPGTHIRILFIFDPNCDAVLLVGGDKTGQSRAWYAEYPGGGLPGIRSG